MITFTMPGKAAVALALDDMETMLEESLSADADPAFAYTVKGPTQRQTYIVTCSVDVARFILGDCDSRAEPPDPSGEGWDQPESWRVACREAAKRIRLALSVAGA